MQPHHHEEDIASNALELLSATSTWLLIRHQWLINTMRCVLTGENPSPLADLAEFDSIIPRHLKLSENMMRSFNEVKASLEERWLEATKAIHPMSGLTIFEQLNNYQVLAHRFMLASKEGNQKLLQEFAMRDTLTGAMTRLTLNASLTQAIYHTTRYNKPSSIAFLDQDGFKTINDHWGHVAGDQVLAKTSEIIQDNLRPHDKLFRYGGDEWLILMPATSEKLANKVIARIQKICSKYPFKAGNDETFHSTFSYGIAESNEDSTPKGWIIQADNQLYARKR